jgi:hypothetical protein
MKKVSLMVVAALLSASMFANSASTPTQGTPGNGAKQKTETGKDNKQKEKKNGGISKEKAAQKSPKQKPATK